ncbi:MAG TPA: DNA polymerase III subunit epsilon [Rudaea sp.]|jgi:DNA polymerase-3 subunit epsilon
MRQVVLDTETTGLEVGKGHRLIEIGCIELLERRPTQRRFHRYLNPQRAIDEGARAVTGISDEFLLDKPLFAQVAAELLEFIGDAELIIHNAAFDLAFLDAELVLAGLPDCQLGGRQPVLDTLALAREKYPGQKNSLDALCRRLEVDNTHRELHGALLDAELLADVYLAMTTGQGDLGLAVASAITPIREAVRATARAALKVLVATADEVAAHAARLSAIDDTSKGRCRWRLS